MKGQILILISCTIVLFFTGVGYSAWTDGLGMEMALTTGVVDLGFSDCDYKIVRDKKDVSKDELDGLNVSINGDTLLITGEVTPKFKAFVKYEITNDSTIPVKYLPDEEMQNLKEDGVRITLNEKETLLEPRENMPHDNGWGNQLTIELDNPGVYEFEYTLPFVPYNSNLDDGWKKELKIKGYITVIDDTLYPEMDLINDDENDGESVVKDDSHIERPETDTNPEDDTTVVDDQADTDLENNTTDEIPTVEEPDGDPVIDENLNEISLDSEIQIETDNNNITDKEIDDGSIENAEDGEE